MKNRIAVIDWLKAFSAVLIIVNHSVHSKLADQTNIFFLLVIENPVPIFMILSGLTFALCYHTYTLSGMFDWHDMVKKFLRFTIPMLFAYFAYLVYMGLQGGAVVYSCDKGFYHL